MNQLKKLNVSVYQEQYDLLNLLASTFTQKLKERVSVARVVRCSVNCFGGMQMPDIGEVIKRSLLDDKEKIEI